MDKRPLCMYHNSRKIQKSRMLDGAMSSLDNTRICHIIKVQVITVNYLIVIVFHILIMPIWN